MSRILLVEPILMNKENFLKTIEGTRYQLDKWVTNGDDAVAHCKQSLPDIIVLSLMAPGHKDNPSEGGIRIIPRLLAIDKTLRIVVTFTVDTQYLTMAALRAGAAEKLKIPFKKESLIESLAKAESSKAISGAAVMRAGLRIKKTLPVKYKLSSESFLKPMRSTISDDISTTGMMLHVSEKIPEKTILKIRIEIPGTKKIINVKGKVIRSKATVGNIYEIGIQFIDVASDDIQVLKNFILSSISRSK